jgi:hypothetical protein
MATPLTITPLSREVTVKISVHKAKPYVRVSQDPFYVSKDANEEVKWVAGKGVEDFLIEFGDDSPFYEKQFSNYAPFSGLVRRNVQPHDGKTYKYTVRVGNLYEDPTGGVKR